MKNPIERPIDLPPDRARQLLAVRRDALVLPMAPHAHLGDAEVRALLAALTKFGCALEDTSPAGVFDLAFREGLLPTPVACLQCRFVVRAGCGAFERVRCTRDFPLLGVACPGRCSTPGGVLAPLVEEV